MKLNSYGLSLTSLTSLLSDHLSNRKQWIKVEKVFSKWENIETGVPQRSIVGPPLFNVLFCDFLILDNTYFASYADDKTSYTINQNAGFVTKALEELSILILSWFKGNKLKPDLGKWHLIVSGTENVKSKLVTLSI